ncbi:MAG: ubiquinone biosynthesis regulatory protein kinase UbiB [Gammaproteobacteria bacterium]|jgi:ubiquinone biosynthesis protein|nr:ubiquinone biosynthesis regulatory protein kinase UbiB [Gammaproteobacteria bacterium]
MRFAAKLIRLIHIKVVFLKYGFDKFIWSHPQFSSMHWMIIFFPWRWFGQQPSPSGEDIRLALSELGPIFVKVGQLLSTRRDLLSDDVADELAKLQDCVPPFSGMLAKNMVEKSLQQPLEAVFSEFNLVPLASASISQVHSATLLTGERVVVKVLRPNIHQQVLRDVELMETIAQFFENFIKTSRRLRPIEVVAEIKQTLIDELDLLREAANASQLRRNFINADTLHVPQIYWQQSRKDVLVIERVHGIPISNVQKLKAHNTNLKVLAERGVEIFFTQVFRDCFFHADMHPGNIFVMIDDPANPKYIAVDFGIMGTLGPDDQRYLGENFLAFFKRDYRKVAELHVQSGWVPPTTPIHAFEAAIRTVCEPIFEKPLKEISFAQTLIRLFQTAQRFDMQVQPQLLLLQKTLLSIEGLGRQLYPDLDLWQTAKPFLEKWMKKHYGPRAFFEGLWNRLPQWTDKLPEVPEAIYDIARFYQDETHRLKYQQLPASLVAQKKPLAIGRKIFGAALLICATLVALAGPYASVIQEYSVWIFGAGIGIGLMLLFI